MQYINLHISALTGPEFVGSEPLDRATWICLLGYCCGQEDGGVIEGCHQWSDRKWQQMAKVTAAEVRRKCDLWKWDGEDLVVNFYPVVQEKQTRSMRKGGIIGNQKRWGKKSPRKQPPDSPPDSPPDCPVKASPDSPPESIIQSKLSKAKLTEVARSVFNSIFCRSETDQWSYLEEQTLAELVGREAFQDELDQVNAYRVSLPPDRRQFFPQSLAGLLTKWTEILDRARGELVHKKNAAHAAAIPGDSPDWWVWDLDFLKNAAAGAYLAGQAEVGRRMDEILSERKGGR